MVVVELYALVVEVFSLGSGVYFSPPELYQDQRWQELITRPYHFLITLIIVGNTWLFLHITHIMMGLEPLYGRIFG